MGSDSTGSSERYWAAEIEEMDAILAEHAARVGSSPQTSPRDFPQIVSETNGWVLRRKVKDSEFVLDLLRRFLAPEGTREVANG